MLPVVTSVVSAVAAIVATGLIAMDRATYVWMVLAIYLMLMFLCYQWWRYTLRFSDLDFFVLKREALSIAHKFYGAKPIRITLDRYRDTSNIDTKYKLSFWCENRKSKHFRDFETAAINLHTLIDDKRLKNLGIGPSFKEIYKKQVLDNFILDWSFDVCDINDVIPIGHNNSWLVWQKYPKIAIRNIKRLFSRKNNRN